MVSQEEVVHELLRVNQHLSPRLHEMWEELENADEAAVTANVEKLDEVEWVPAATPTAADNNEGSDSEKETE